MPTPRRARADACPGVLATHQAADGALARVRLPGGRMSARQLRALADCAEQHGDGVLYLTSRANVQLRGLTPEGDKPLAVTLSDHGLLPAPELERVRNYLASPASGYFGGRVDLRPMLTALDEAVCANPELAALPGRFLFGLDDGRGDVAKMDTDVCWQARDGGGGLLVGGADTGLRVGPGEAVRALVHCAEEFVAQRGEAWRVRELPGTVEPFAAEVGPKPCIGASEQDDGGVAVCAAPVLGELTTEQAGIVAAESDELVVTPWRTVLVPDIEPGDADAVLSRFADAGLVVDPEVSGPGVSSCIGTPGCTKAHADVRTHARELLPLLPADTRMHFSGCERRCGRPGEPHTDVLATEDGYRVDGARVGISAAKYLLRWNDRSET